MSNISTQFKKGNVPKHPFKKGVKSWNTGLSPELQPAYKNGKTLGENKKEYYRKKHQERIARKYGAEGGHTQGDWETLKAQYNWICPCCKKSEPEIKLTEDHIIPLIKGGSDNIENIQPLCGKCNSIKGAKIINFNTNICLQ
jgi:hypothetical protein